MSVEDKPDFGEHGLTAVGLLGENRSAGRSTWLCGLQDGRQVVVKRFSFASPGASWDAYREHERELAVLRELEHPGIPRFVAAYPTADGFLLVQEWIDARPLSARMSFASGEVEGLARKVLDVLVYLQERTPAVVHRDLKPDNILLGDDGRVYLVDFGLARSVHESTSTIAVGTPGFMPPEQMLGHRLGPASDLYGLGATLIACLTGARGHGVRELVDSTFRFDLSGLPGHVDKGFVRWLERLVEPDLKRRFPDARTALAALDEDEVRPDVGVFPALADTPDVPVARWTPPSSPFENVDVAQFERHAKLKVAVGFGSVLLIAAAALVWTTSRPEEVTAQPNPSFAGFEGLGAPESVEQALGMPEIRAAPPRTCSTTMILEDQDFRPLPHQSPLVATRGCDLTLRGVRIQTRLAALNLQSGAKVRLENSTIEVEHGPAVSVRDKGSELTLVSASLNTTGGTALEVGWGGRATMVDSIVTGPVAIHAGRDARVEVATTQVSGEVVEDGGFVFGLDAAKDEARRRSLKADAYGHGGCSGVANCLSESGYRGRVDLDVYARTSDGAIDAVRVWTKPGAEVTKDAAACIEREAKSRRVEGWDGSELGYRYCQMSGEVHGRTQMLSNAEGFVFALDNPENAASLEAMFR
jgi:serine/threonine protein kinase